MRDQIQQQFNSNIGRVKNLIDIYRNRLSTTTGSGRRPVHATDVLRSATVFLHASLEDFLRGLMIWKWPSVGSEILDKVPLIGTSSSGRPEKFFLGKLTAHRHKSVQQTIQESITAHTHKVTFNNTTDVSVFLQTIDVVPDLVNARYPDIATLMSRRHHIVHQADRNPNEGKGQHAAQSLSPDTVEGWADAVVEFEKAVMREVPE